jgi:hypothetical protein
LLALLLVAVAHRLCEGILPRDPSEPHADFALGAIQGFDQKECSHCGKAEPFSEFLKPKDADTEGAYTMVHILWPTHVEKISTTSDAGGWEKPTLHSSLAAEVLRGWREFNDDIYPKLAEGHDVRRHVSKGDPFDRNRPFYAWQQSLFKAHGDVAVATESTSDLDVDKDRCAALGDAAGEEEAEDGTQEVTSATCKARRSASSSSLSANSTWPSLQALPEYARLQLVVDKLSRRYMERGGVAKAQAWSMNTSVFSWAAVHESGDFSSTFSIPGNHHVALFYAQAGPGSSKLRLGDPRGHSYPFGREFFHSPRAGDLLIFPSWMSQMITVTPPSDSVEDSRSVVFTFVVSPVDGQMTSDNWWTDPAADLRFSRASAIDKQIFQK